MILHGTGSAGCGALIARIRACACGERSIAACRHPGTRRSSTNSPAPVISRGSSRRLTTPACSAIPLLYISLSPSGGEGRVRGEPCAGAPPPPPPPPPPGGGGGG